MALTRITKGVIKPNENYDTHNINSTGIVTATGLNISGNASIGGVLTYEDVTNIDSVGVITARSGVDVEGIVKIYGNSSGHGIRIDPNSTGGTYETLLGTPNGDLRLQAGNASYFASQANILLESTSKDIYINAGTGISGDVGIGTDNAVSKLHVGGNFSVITQSPLTDVNHTSAARGGNALFVSNNSTVETARFYCSAAGNTKIHIECSSNNGESELHFCDQEDRTSYTGGADHYDNSSGKIIYDHSDDSFRFDTNRTEKLRIGSDGGTTITTVGDTIADSFSLKVGQTNENSSSGSGPHYGLLVNQLGGRYHLNVGVYSEVLGTNGLFSGTTFEGMTKMRSIGVVGISTVSSEAYQKGIGVYGKVLLNNYNYNDVYGVKGLARPGTDGFSANNTALSYAGYGGHFVAHGNGQSIGVYADAYLDGSPGANQEAIPLKVASNGTELLRIDSSGKLLIGINASTSNDANLQSFKPTGNNSTIVVGNVATSVDGLCRVDFCPSNSTIGGRIECHATEDFSTVANRTADLVFVTRKDGTNSEKLRITSGGDIVINGNIHQSNSSIGSGYATKTFVLSRSYTMSTSSTDVLTLGNWGNSAFDITVFRRDHVSPAGAQVMKLYLAFAGSGTNMTSATIVQETKVTRGSIHTTTYSISEDNNDATLSVTGNDNGGESQHLIFYIIAHGSPSGFVNVI